jgi:WD40 repeat protein
MVPEKSVLIGAPGIHSLAISPDGTRLGFGSLNRDGQPIITLVNAATDRVEHVLQAHCGHANLLTFAPSGKTLISACGCRAADGGKVYSQVITWDLATGRPSDQIEVENGGKNLALSLDGTILVSRGAFPDPIARAWNLTNRKGVSLEGHSKNVDLAAVSANGTRVATVGGKPHLIVWEYPTGKKLWSYDFEDRLGSKESPSYVAFSPDGTLVVVMAAKHSSFFEVATGKPIREEKIGSRVGGAFSPDSKLIALCVPGHGVVLWDIEKRRRVMDLVAGGDKSVSTVVFAPNGRFVAAKAASGAIRIWELPKLER